jgi:cyclohexanone monooxygenase
MEKNSDIHSPSNEVTEVDALIIGAGFAGMYSLIRCRQMGFRALAVDAAGDVGGTWFWNRYPGARCDIRSIDYSYSFDPELEQEWEWSEKYATQPEILAYANHVADRYDLRRDIRFSTRVTQLQWQNDVWNAQTDTGEELRAQFVIMAVGALSQTKNPEVEGAETFNGTIVHTGHWPATGVDVRGKRVAVIGTGSSGVQAIPLLAQEAAELIVFQRTPNYVVPAQNRKLDADEVADIKASYRQHRHAQRYSHGGVVSPQPTKSLWDASEQERQEKFDAAWDEGMLFSFLGSYTDVMIDESANEVVAEYLRNRIRSIVKDQNVAEKLCPRSYPLGTKRLCLGTNYYETFNRENVSLVDLRETPIERIVASGIETSAQTYEVDVIVFATGFDAMTGPLLGPIITGVSQKLSEAWEAGPQTFMGIAAHDFPNMFMITAPQSPSVLTNMMVSIEQHVEWATDLMSWMRDKNFRVFNPQLEPQTEWVSLVNMISDFTLYPKGNSWYLGANVPGKPRIFMPYLGGVGPYREQCDEVANDNYRGIDFS